MNSSTSPAFNDWRTSSYCGTNGECVKVAAADGRVAIGDSKGAGMLIVTEADYENLLSRIKKGMV
ncbi:DUF397 domain-containing protein [Nonomuraea fuscirosea]|uniref:DUF397 domain-containing protein n=1 Tax=Nonomuraea fuscirosea TaxID=1291556 RepID=UPI002DDAF710|nr:DUF397 domain-containing protein [Nonomuraea fuscirosea]WSA57121.1 DUF397 domain-containing protein [Nonomuraea fuscirosea]